MFKLWGKEYDFGFDKLFPRPDPNAPKEPVPAVLRKYRRNRQEKRRVANASRRRNRGN